jgi:hypothetical protein
MKPKMKEQDITLLDYANDDRKRANQKSQRPHHLSPVCSHCGAPTVEFRHGLSRQLGEILCQIYRFGKPFKVRDLCLNYSKASNFQKLRYWELVEHDAKTETWWLSKTGEDFVRCVTRLKKYAWTYRGEVVEHDGPEVLITDLVPDFNHRVDYARESRPHDEAQ